MTENNSEFSQEPHVGIPAVNVSDKVIESAVLAEAHKAENNEVAHLQEVVSTEMPSMEMETTSEVPSVEEEITPEVHPVEEETISEVPSVEEEITPEVHPVEEETIFEVPVENEPTSEVSLAEKEPTSEVPSTDEEKSTEITSVEDEKMETQSEAPNSGCEDKLHSLQDYWLKLNAFFKKVYHTILDGEKPPDEFECHVDIIKDLVDNDPHQLFARLEMDLQEFIIEIKLRQMELLNCVHTEEGPHLFIFCLIESYNKLMFAANTLSPLLQQLEAEHLSKFNITWRGLNQHLFHKLVFTEPKIQKILPLCISKLGKISTELSDFNKRLIRQFLSFDDEMTQIGGKWREAESSIIKYHQENSMLDAKQRMMKINWELIKAQTKLFHEELKFSGDDLHMNVDLQNMQELETCECCHSSTECSDTSVPLPLDSYFEIKGSKSCSHSQCEPSCKDLEILSQLNAEGRKLYENVYRFKIQQKSLNEEQNARSTSTASTPSAIEGKENNAPNSDQTLSSSSSSSSCDKQNPQQQPQQQNSQPLTSSAELHKNLIRKQVIHQQRQQHQKKLMQMIQSSQQKEIQHKIQKQLQEHQLLLQQQRKIDELHAHLLQQHPMHLDKDIQKKVHLQMQQRLMQKHKHMEDKFHQQVQEHMQQHQDKQTCAGFPKSNVGAAASQASSALSNSASGKLLASSKPTQKCPISASSGGGASTTLAVSLTNLLNTTATNSNNAPVVSAKAAAPGTAVNVKLLKSSTTQTNPSALSGIYASQLDGQSRNRHHPLPDVVKSSSYVCPKHSNETGKHMAHNHHDHSCSDNSSDDDYSSERSNSPQRHCDCCYCEVFGSAPVSRNFQETRERLRLLLTKKKAKSNSATASSEKPTSEQTSPNTNGTQTQSASQGNIKMKKEDVEYKGDKSIEEILDFIEGNKTRNVKRTAKKLRRKQRQLEEEERKRKEEEAERLRLEELRRKEEEEKRKQEEERRRHELRKEQNKKKGKKKNEKLEKQLQKQLKNAAAAAAAELNQKGGKNKKNQVQNATAADKTGLRNGQNSTYNKMAGATVNQKLTSQQQLKQISQTQQQQKKQKQDQQTSQSKQQQQNKLKGQQGKNSNVPSASSKKTQNQQNDSTGGQPQMVTIKRVIQPNSNEPTVTITLRGNTPKEDKVLYTLTNGQSKVCQVKDEKGKKKAVAAAPTVPNNNSATSKKNTKPNPVTFNNNSNNIPNSYNSVYSISNANNQPPLPSRSVPYHHSSKNGSNITGNNSLNSITDRLENLKLGPHVVPNEPAQKYIPAPNVPPQAELTTATAIQINQAVNQLSSRPAFPNNFDLENIKLPPGITITKVDPASVNRKPIQMKQHQIPSQPLPQTHIRQTMMPSVAGSSNVIVVDTGEKNNFYPDEPILNGSKKKRRRRKKESANPMVNPNHLMNNTTSAYNGGGPAGGMPPRMGAPPMNPNLYGSSFMNNDYRNVPQQPAAIIQMNGSMVTIRNPALHHALTAGQQMEYHDGTKVNQHSADLRNSNFDENMFSSASEEMENGDVDEYERELEAFKRFCSQSVPAESKAKVNLNLEDIVLKKKGPVIGCS